MSAERQNRPELIPQRKRRVGNNSALVENGEFIIRESKQAEGKSFHALSPVIDRADQKKQFPAVLEKKPFGNKAKVERPSVAALQRFIATFGNERRDGESDKELLQRIRNNIPSNVVAGMIGVHSSEVSRLARALGASDLKTHSRKKFDIPGTKRSSEKKQFGEVKLYTQENPNTSAFRGYRKFMEVFGSERKVNETDKELFERIRERYSIKQLREITGIHSNELGYLKKSLGAKNKIRGVKLKIR